MRKTILCLTVIILSSSFKKEGLDIAYLNCKSESGRTIFTAEIQDIDGELENAEVTIDGEKLKFTKGENSNVIFESRNGFYSIVIENNSKANSSKPKFLKFWAIPKTFKTVVSNGQEFKYTFQAQLFCTDPRKDKNLLTPEIKMNCTLLYNYKI